MNTKIGMDECHSEKLSHKVDRNRLSKYAKIGLAHKTFGKVVSSRCNCPKVWNSTPQLFTDFTNAP